MTKRITARIRGEESGFTLLELLIVLAIIGILMLIAIPAFMGFRDRAASLAVKGNLRNGITSAETYALDNGSYTGMTLPLLIGINPGIDAGLTVVSATATTYCLADTASGKTMSVIGPSQTYFTGATCS